MGEKWVVVPYRPEWPAAFEREAERLRRVFADVAADVEHVGSTAVPGLGAKPIIDVMLGVDDLAVVAPRISELRALGYEYVPDYEAEIPDRRYFRKPQERPRTHHLHVVLKQGSLWSDHLAFRNYLRANPSVALEYYELKVRLARECSASGADYSSAKSSFIKSVLELARPGEALVQQLSDLSSRTDGANMRMQKTLDHLQEAIEDARRVFLPVKGMSAVADLAVALREQEVAERERAAPAESPKVEGRGSNFTAPTFKSRGKSSAAKGKRKGRRG